MCCGQVSNANQAKAVADGSVVNLYYFGRTHIQLRGAVSGQFYQFSRTAPVQPVDPRDVSSMLQTRLFRRTR
jgi:hypothetical protein